MTLLDYFRRAQPEPIEPAAIEPSVEQQAADREADALGLVGFLKRQLATLDSEMRDCRTRHGITTDNFGRITRCRGDSGTARAQIESEWRELQKRANQLRPAFAQALETWSTEKQARDKREG